MVGDFLALNEVVVAAEHYAGNVHICDSTEYTGRSCLVEVVYILDDKAGRFLQPGYVVLSIRPCHIHTASEYMTDACVRSMYEVPTYRVVTTKEETA